MVRFGRAIVDGQAIWVVEQRHQLWRLGAPPWEGIRSAGDALDPSALTPLPPVVPSKILCVGRNYALHAKERGAEMPSEPMLFLKPPSALLVSGGDVELPAVSAHVEMEGELAFVIGRRVRHFAKDADPREVIAGWLCADDVSARDLQKSDNQWARAKGFDTACPVSRWASADPPPPGARLRTHLNGELRQDAPLSDMAYDAAAILAHATAVMTLEPGDLVLTGTPAGCSKLAPGDRVEVTIDGLDPLVHGVRAG